jgi:tetratricopeptide (TPR) repeat protein
VIHCDVGPFLVALFCLAQAGPPLEYSQLVTSAANHIREKHLDAAIQDLTRAAALQPRSAAVHLLLGQAYLGKGTPGLVAQAKAEFQEARDLDPSQVLPSFYIAKIDLDLGRISQAERELRRALEKKPGEHYLLALLGEVRRQQGDTEEAIELTTKALAAGPEALPVYYFRALAWRDRKDDTRALQDLDHLLNSPFATVDAFMAAGTIHLDKNRLTEAESSFRKAIQLDPERAEPHLRLAQALRRERRFDLAMKELSRVETAPQLSSPYFQKLLADTACERGLIYSDEGDRARAKASFQRALEIDPAHAEALNRLKP